MKIDSIGNQTFEAKKFRLITTAVNYDRAGTTLANFRNCGKYVQEYSNPNAKALYEKAQRTINPEEQIRLYNEMGHYELKTLNLAEIIREKFNKLIMDYLF